MESHHTHCCLTERLQSSSLCPSGRGRLDSDLQSRLHWMPGEELKATVQLRRAILLNPMPGKQHTHTPRQTHHARRSQRCQLASLMQNSFTHHWAWPRLTHNPPGLAMSHLHWLLHLTEWEPGEGITGNAAMRPASAAVYYMLCTLCSVLWLIKVLKGWIFIFVPV